MKRLVSIFLTLSFAVMLFAQESTVLTSKKGLPILPEKGDFAIGINAGSLLSVFKDGISSPSFDYIQDNTLMLKYFLSERSALRVNFRIGTMSLKEGDSNFDNYQTMSETNMNLGAGYERRLGSGRVQGFFGAEGGIIYSRQVIDDSDGTIYTDLSGFGFGLGVFLGAEYFVAPKLSLGGQFSWGLSYMTATDNDSEDKVNAMMLDVDNMGGAIMLTFHF